MNEGLAQQVHTLATRLRYRLVNRPGGPPTQRVSRKLRPNTWHE